MLKVAADFNRQASKLADSMTAKIFIQAYKSMIIKDQVDFDDDEHFRMLDKRARSIGCGCKLCRLRFKFVNLKLERHRAYKRATNDDYVYRGTMTAAADFDLVDELDEKMASIVYEKSLIKERLGYDKSKKSTQVPFSTPVYGRKISNLRTRGILLPEDN